MSMMTDTATAPPDWWPQANPDALAYVREHGLIPLPWQELKSQLEFLSQPVSFPLRAVRIAQAAWPRYADHFRATLAEFLQDPARVADNRYALHVFAGYLLAEHRDPHGFDLAQRLLALSGNQLDALLGDDWTDTLSAWVAAFCCNDPQHLSWLTDVALDPGRWAHQRLAAVEALVRCCGQGLHESGECQSLCLKTLQSMATTGCRIDPGSYLDSDSLMGLLLAYFADLGVPDSALPQIESWYAQDLIDPSIITLNAIRDAKQPSPHLRGLPDCCVKEMGWWAWFKEAQELPASSAGPWPGFTNESGPNPVVAADLGIPYVRPESKTGRNDPCPCGSGRKFKKCCGA